MTFVSNTTYALDTLVFVPILVEADVFVVVFVPNMTANSSKSVSLRYATRISGTFVLEISLPATPSFV